MKNVTFLPKILLLLAGLIADYRHDLAETNEDNMATLALDVVVPQVDLTFPAFSNGSPPYFWQ